MLLGEWGLEELTYIYGQWNNTEQYVGFSLSGFYCKYFSALRIPLHLFTFKLLFLKQHVHWKTNVR